MRKNKPLAFDSILLIPYAVFAATLEAAGIGLLDNPVTWLLLSLALVWVDLRSFNQGMDRGIKITKEVWGIPE